MTHKAKIFAIWYITEKVCQPWPRMWKLKLYFVFLDSIASLPL